MTRSLSDDSLKRHVDHVRNRHLTTQDVASTSPRSPWSSVRLRQSGNQPAQPQHLLQSPVKSPRLPIPEFKPDDQEGDSQLTDAELQTVMSVYARPLDDYMELYIQFGYVLLFSPAFPLAAICALINNLIEVRVDSFKLCSVVQRPFGRMVKDIGAWQRAMEIMGVVGVVVNCALIAQSRVMQRLWPGMSYTSEIIIVVILEHVILATKWLIDCAIPDVPEWIRVETVRNELWRREAFKRESRLLTDEGRQRHRQPHHGNRRSMTPAAGRNELKLLL